MSVLANTFVVPAPRSVCLRMSDSVELKFYASQFSPHDRMTWPRKFTLWGAEEAHPRDMSWGRIGINDLQVHVLYRDWFIWDKEQTVMAVVSDEHFLKHYRFEEEEKKVEHVRSDIWVRACKVLLADKIPPSDTTYTVVCSIVDVDLHIGDQVRVVNVKESGNYLLRLSDLTIHCPVNNGMDSVLLAAPGDVKEIIEP